ncbi:MAG TPA: ABC transporter ATP-binding protein [bacterium]|nr:ABC transporter ATP-binding protein [bacterium]HMW32109.1 ABC transporter ATP-binding protein [bacterium]HMY34777.1 ABC transporter ATP-binding protein [bacterium]HMZ03887.1 ABC transporter ATP-binding protein [bacterium]HNB08550.1 ABC transporter ATP-binding protein [bacterium]
MTVHNQPVLEAAQLTKRYDDGALALNGISFQVHPGEIYAMLGGNGAGKTTTINIFFNFITPTSGEAKVKGIITHQEPLRAKEQMAFVSENVMLYPNFTAMENLEFFAKLGGRADITESEMKVTLSRVGLQSEAMNKKVRTFSKGMRQKCGIAIAIIKKAPAIILDEPTSGLDPKAGYEFNRLLIELKQEGKAILMSTHDIFRAKEVADHIGIMNRGSIVMQKNRDELAHEDLEKLYIEYMAGYMEPVAV